MHESASISGEERHAFLLKLSDALAPLTDASEIAAVASRLLGEHLGVDRVAYAEVGPDGDSPAVAKDWTCPGMPSVAGTPRAVELGPVFTAALSNGKTATMEDAVVHPIVKSGRPAAVLFVHSRAPRRWATEEITLVTEVGERTASAVERARAHEALRASDARYRTLAVERASLLEAERAARADADQAARGQDEFLATVSHELRAPATSMLSWARLLQSKFGAGQPLLAQGLRAIVENGLAQSQLIADLLDSSKILEGKVALELAEVQLNELLVATCATQKLAAQNKGVAVSCELPDELGTIVADRARVRLVLTNLLSNAIKFTTRGGRVAVTGRVAGSRRVIEVQDTGEGIDPALLPFLFDRFRQADGGRSRRHGGLGLGLAIAKQIVEMHGGRIEASSLGQGRGSKFTVSLPEIPAHITMSDDPQTAFAADASLQGIVILAVEDQAFVREYLRRTLVEHKARVTVVESAKEALELLRAGADAPAFDLLISDIGLPDMDGYDFMRVVRHELGATPERLPAVAVTAYGRDQDRQNALAAGYQAHLVKPYSVGSLVNLVRRLSNR